MVDLETLEAQRERKRKEFAREEEEENFAGVQLWFKKKAELDQLDEKRRDLVLELKELERTYPTIGRVTSLIKGEATKLANRKYGEPAKAKEKEPAEEESNAPRKRKRTERIEDALKGQKASSEKKKALTNFATHSSSKHADEVDNSADMRDSES